MVGQGVLRECLQAPDVVLVQIVGRSPSGISHPKLRELLHADLWNFAAVENRLSGFDACFFCLGVSAAKVSATVAWPNVSGALAESGNSGMAASCQATRGCIAYIGISYRHKTHAAGLGTASLRNRSGNFVQPTSASIAAAAALLTGKTPASEALSMINGPAANGYPIVNYEYAIVSTTQPSAIRAQDIRAFLHWTVHTGQDPATYLRPVGFQPLPSSVIPLSDQQIAKIGR